MIDSRIRLKAYNPRQTSLFLHRAEDELSKDHFCFFVYDLLNEFYEQGSLKPFYDRFESRKIAGRPANNPLMMLGVLCYSYANGIFSSRKIEKKLREDVALRFLCGDNFLSYRTICRFRKAHLKDFNDLFVKVINHAANMCDFDFNNIDFNEIGIDSTKIKAGASRLKNRKDNDKQKTTGLSKKRHSKNT
ncbi:MAG: transposase [Proteobacteria bacterium]|nr:transposase [Pseudomonadota bacterium]